MRIAWLSALSETMTSRPDRIEDVAAMDGVAAPLDEEHQQVEIAGNQRLRPAGAQEDASAWREDEFVEPV